MADVKKKNNSKKRKNQDIPNKEEQKKNMKESKKQVTKKTSKQKKQDHIINVEKKDLKVESKKVKKTSPKKIEKKVEPKSENLNKQEQLERTIIFDGAQKRNIEEVVENLEKENIVLKDKVVKRNKVNKYIVITLIILILLIMICCSIYTAVSIKEQMELNKPVETLYTNIFNKVEALKDEELFNEEQSDNKKNNIKDSAITQITLKEFEQKILKKEKLNILISSSSCYFCYTFEPTIEKTLKELGKKIYKIDIYEMSKEEVEKLREYYPFTITPTIFTIEDGIVTKEKTGSQTEDDFKKWAQENLV